MRAKRKTEREKIREIERANEKDPVGETEKENQQIRDKERSK